MNDPGEEFTIIRARLDTLEGLFDEVSERLKTAQHILHARADQGFSVAQLEDNRAEAVALYESFLDILIEQSVLAKRLQE